MTKRKTTPLKPTNETAEEKRRRLEREDAMDKIMWKDPRRYFGRIRPVIADD